MPRRLSMKRSALIATFVAFRVASGAADAQSAAPNCEQVPELGILCGEQLERFRAVQRDMLERLLLRHSVDPGLTADVGGPIDYGARLTARASPDDGAPMLTDVAPAPPGEPAGAPTGDVRTTRLFGDADDFPPENFAAYAILAAPGSPAGPQRSRYLAICQGYMSELTASSSGVAASLAEQLVTVWPVRDAAMSRFLSLPAATIVGLESRIEATCPVAVDGYDSDIAKAAITHAETGAPPLLTELRGRRGPFLLAWSPAAQKGDPDVPIFRMDLSWVETRSQAELMFGIWRAGILERADLWRPGWQRPGARARVRLMIENVAADAMGGIEVAAGVIELVMPGGEE